jgi:hypothetical protein
MVVKRAAVSSCEDFPHFKSQHRYIIEQFDDQLNREVVYLEQVCWLYFKKRFAKLPPGKWNVVLREYFIAIFPCQRRSRTFCTSKGMSDLSLSLKLNSGGKGLPLSKVVLCLRNLKRSDAHASHALTLLEGE